MIQAAVTLTLAIGVNGCGDMAAPAEPSLDSPPPSAQPSPPPARVLPSAPADSGCRVTENASLAATAPSTRLTLVRGGHVSQPGTLGLTLLVETGTTELIRLTPDFRVRARRTVRALFAAAVGTETGIVALAAGPADAAGPSRYQVWQLGEAPADDFRTELPVPARATGAIRRHASGSQVVFAWTDGRQPPLALRLFTARAQPPRFDAAYAFSPTVELDDARAVQLLRVALDDTSFAAIVREGAAEAEDSRVWLARPTGRVPVPALQEVADIESLAVVGEQVWAIGTLEFSRPLLFRILPSGELDGPPEELARDATLPPPLAGGDPARLLVEGSRLLLRRRNAMGDPLLPDTVVTTRGDASLPADVLRDGLRYVVVYQDRDEAGGTWPIRVVSLDCSSR